MLTYTLNRDGTESLYENIYRLIRDDIQSGALKGGTKLPSKRAFAEQLSVSTITVENAYAQLLTEGYIVSRPRQGFFVADFEGISEMMTSGEKPESAMMGESHKSGDERMEYYADFVSNQTLPESFPFSVWAKVCREVLSEQQLELMTNAPAQGVFQLREAIAEHLQQFRGMKVHPDQIIIGAGTEYLYGMLIQLTGLDKCYASENPGYRKIAQVFQSYGLNHCAVPMDQSGISVEALEALGVNVVHVTPSHHFPTGITMPAKRRYELLQWAAAEDGRYIIEDDYDSEFRMTGRPLPALFDHDTLGHVIYMNTFTRSLASTIRVSYMILPEPLLDTYWKKLSFYSCPVSTFDQYTLARFIKEGYFEKHINRMRNASRKKRNLLLENIAASGLDRIAVISEEDAGLHFLLKMNSGLVQQDFQRKLEEEGIRLNSLDRYLAEEYIPEGEVGLKQGGYKQLAMAGSGNGWSHEEARLIMVMNYASVPEDKIPEAVHRICRAAELRECVGRNDP